MANVLYRLGRWVARHPLIVIVAWLGIAVCVGIAVSRIGAETSNDLSLPGTGSQRATDLLASRFPPQQNGKNPIVFHVSSGKLTASANKAAITQSVDAIRKLPHVVSAVSPFDQKGAAQLSKDARTAFVPVLLDVGSADLDTEDAEAILDAADPAREAGMEVAAGNAVGSELSKPETEISEVIGIVAAMIILTLALGAIVAMGMPIVTAVVGLILGLSAIGLLGHLATVPTIAPTLATMIGLGVGIDYALFLVMRHRDQLRQGMEPRESIARAVGTSGSAIVFAGGTVVIALIALAVAGIPLVASLGYASAVAVLTAVLAAITLMPALLSLVGRRLESLRLPALLRPKEKPAGRGFWVAWARWVTTRPWLALALALAILVPLAIPLLSLELGQEDIGATPPSTTERQAYDLMAAGFGVGYNGPLLVATELGSPATPSEAVTKQENQLTSLQKELQQEQAEGQKSQKQLQAEGAQLQREATDLQQRQAALEQQGASLQAQAATLRAQEADLRARAATLERERSGLRDDREQLRAQARALLAQADGLVRRGLALRVALERNRAAQARLEEELQASTDPARRRVLQARIAELASRGRRLQAELDAVASRVPALRRQARQLRAQAASVRSRGPRLRAEAQALLGDARGLAAQAAGLERQRRTLEAQASELARQADALKAQQADLEAQKADLEQLQARAKKQQAQAEKLKDQLTATLTKAGGDDRGTDPRLVALQDALSGTQGVSVVSPPQINKAGNAAVYTAIPTTAPAANETADLVGDLRSDVIPTAIGGTDLTAFVGGSTASNVDLAAEISSRLPLVILTVLALCVLVLLLAFRSLLIPLQAAVTNLVCVAAAFGVLTATFQFGWGIGLVGVDTSSDTVPIASFVPLMMFAVLFGLSMDYQVFLLSQIAQHRAEGEDDRGAVASGLATSARVITAAALIMIGVFASYVLDGDPTVKQFGVGLATAVALAASMVLLLTPAVLVLLGRGSWWLPGWLERIVPRIDIEGTELGTDRPVVAAAGEPLPGPGSQTRKRPGSV